VPQFESSAGESDGRFLFASLSINWKSLSSRAFLGQKVKVHEKWIKRRNRRSSTDERGGERSRDLYFDVSLLRQIARLGRDSERENFDEWFECIRTRTLKRRRNLN
jgi:hypothetical protein